jgi:hypothetical protein
MASLTTNPDSTSQKETPASANEAGAPLALKWLADLLDGGEPARGQDGGKPVKTAAA